MAKETVFTRAPLITKPSSSKPSRHQDLPRLKIPKPNDRWPTKLNPRYPCHCLSTAAYFVFEAAISSAIPFYHVIAERPSGRKDVPIAPWKSDLIRIRISIARTLALKELEKQTGVVMHNKRDSSTEFSSHVQPWATAFLHRAAISAGNEAFKEIDQREGAVKEEGSQEIPPYTFKLPGTLYCNSFMRQYPCLCKDATANKIADLVFENFLKDVPPHAEKHSAMSWVKGRLNIRVATATVHALEEIAEPGDEKHKCSAYGRPPHMLRWMYTTVKAACEKAVAQEFDMVKRELAKKKALEKHLAVHPDRTLLGASLNLDSSSTIASRPGSSGSTMTLPRDYERGISMETYAETLNSFAESVTLAVLMHLFPARKRELTNSWMRHHFEPAVTDARKRALEVIARYDSITHAAGIANTGSSMHDYQWKTSFMTFAISKAADRAVAKLGIDKGVYAEVWRSKPLMSGKTSELAAAQGLVEFATKVIINDSKPEESNGGEVAEVMHEVETKGASSLQ